MSPFWSLPPHCCCLVTAQLWPRHGDRSPDCFSSVFVVLHHQHHQHQPQHQQSSWICSSSDGRYSLWLVRLACGHQKGLTLIDRKEGTNLSWTFLIGVLVRGKTSESSAKQFFRKIRCALPKHSRSWGDLRVPLLMSTGVRLTCW